MQQPSEGLHFGKYKLLERIATGGMAEIYRARMTAAAGVTKPVVIKKILPGYAGNTAFVSMFVNEARIAAGLSHGNIAQVFDFGEVDGQYFIAMEFVDGQPLSRVMRRAREKGLYTLPQPLALLIAVEVLEGLAYAHTRLDERGRPLHIVHRDVSPQNVLLGYEGQVKLVDFGIAKARLAGRNEAGEAGEVMGKYAYFAPEQARGRELDARTDVFAAGVVLYEMLCGRLPFEGKMADVLRKVALGDFPRPRDLNPDLPPALERILLTALAVEREQRYPTAEAFAEALTRYLHTAAPDVSPRARAHFMGYLFEAELVEDGRPVLLPREFLAQMARWTQGSAERRPSRVPTQPRDTAPALDEPARKGHRNTDRISHETPGAQDTGEPGSTTQPIPPESLAAEPSGPTTQPIPPESLAAEPPSPGKPSGIPLHLAAEQTILAQQSLSVVPTPREVSAQNVPRTVAPVRRLRLPRGVVLGAPVAVALTVMGAMLTMGNTGTFSVELSSTPPGATIRVDGRPLPSRTPALITHLPADGEHLLEVHVTGMVPWSQTVRAERGTTLAVHARLRSRMASGSSPQTRPARLPPPQEATMPVDRITLSAVGHAFRVPFESAAEVKLDPKRTYDVRVEGRLSTGGPMTVEQAGYFLEGTEQLPAHESFGLIGTEERPVSNATMLYVFLLDAKREDNHGSLQVRVRERDSGTVTTVRLDARAHALKLSRADRFLLRQLDPDTTYEVVLRDSPEPARTRGYEGGPVGRMLGLYGAGEGPETESGVLELLEVGQPVRLRGASWLMLAFPDDHLADNTGTLLLEVSPVVPPVRPPPVRAPGRMFDAPTR
ncbi:protein kinase [Pyxidicoccus parkwayensis]|uniref:Protein kinase n=1 Tax=Pyxidicoccus parkwayensis TaxID=2813578 RepID=A0ABX7NZX8_9BACT|nr:serine/threonine-protein kinase [Pyxidicoccus parkwaysis]QSQ24028.1 protein kinase [Pyxidicoccus parkwaysis]